MGATDTAPCMVSVDKACVQAFFVFDEHAEPTQITREYLVQLLSEANVKLSSGLEKRVDKLAELLQQGKLPTKPVLVVKGRPCDNGDDGSLELDPTLDVEREKAEAESTGAVSWYEQQKIITVTEGQVLGKVHPPRPAKPGEDVFGQPIKSDRKRHEVNVGKGVRFDDDGLTVVAACDGRLVHERLDVAVLDVLEIEGNVDFESGNVEAASDVAIRADVLDLFKVVSRKSIEVGGSIEAAEVHADKDILVRGGICGKEKGEVTCGGELRAKYCENAKITSEGDVFIAKEAINSTIMTNGTLSIASGSLIGGKAHARNGGEVKVLGSDAGVKTRLGIGMDPATLYAIAEVDEKVKTLKETGERIRATVNPLIQNLRRLTTEQREKATELICQADGLDSQVLDLEGEKEQLLERAVPVDGASLTVTGRICEGVAVTVDRHSLRFEKEVKGPIRIEKRKVEDVTEVVSVNLLTGSITILPARKLDLPDVNADASAPS